MKSTQVAERSFQRISIIKEAVDFIINLQWRRKSNVELENNRSFSEIQFLC
jgi:hypothetical protein